MSAGYKSCNIRESLGDMQVFDEFSSNQTHIVTCSVSPATHEKTLVVMDAGIATEDNLLTIKEKGYNYLCVSLLFQNKC